VRFISLYSITLSKKGALLSELESWQLIQIIRTIKYKKQRSKDMINGFHHAQITIPKDKENEARNFYCGILKLKEIPKPETLIGRGGFWVQVGERELHIGTEDGVDRTLTKAHLAYEVNDIKTIQKILRENGIELLESVPIPGYERFEFRDPFGNRVECIKPLKNQ
jgi:catechol 2,3-dioxygenase-like lactoylglutathione lyase family enzyme